MTNLTSFLESNQHLLEQLRLQLAVLSQNNNSIYSDAIPIIGGASIGAHLRHILDFYNAYYYGSSKGHIDYDDRQRNTKIENELAAGLEQILVVIEQLEEGHSLNNKTVTVNTAVETNRDKSIGESNLIRELQSLHSHTTHHMAIIAIVLKLNKINVDNDFGKAPSTIQYERSCQNSSNSSISNKYQ